jgi:N-methylhydantoinase A/oxoprolinase/acetone carboxylase beta subunit
MPMRLSRASARSWGWRTTRPLPADRIAEVKMGTTVATNALLERKVRGRCWWSTRALPIVIGDQTRPRLFDLAIRRPAPLHDGVIEIGGRIDADGVVVLPLDEASAPRSWRRNARRVSRRWRSRSPMAGRMATARQRALARWPASPRFRPAMSSAR